MLCKGEGTREPAKERVKNRRFESKDAAEIYAQGINDYRRDMNPQYTSEYVVREAER